MFVCPLPRVGNLLGSGQPHTARLSAWLCVAVGGIFMASNACVILLARNHVGRAFTNDAAVIAVMASIAPMAALFQVKELSVFVKMQAPHFLFHKDYCLCGF
jgi:Na+-driven multidrug efflux pump